MLHGSEDLAPGVDSVEKLGLGSSLDKNCMTPSRATVDEVKDLVRRIEQEVAFNVLVKPARDGDRRLGEFA